VVALLVAAGALALVAAGVVAMSPWARVPPGVEVRCGGCGAPIAEGAPVYHILVALGVRLKHALVRCEACEGAAPPDLPARLAAAPPARVRLPAFASVAALAGDWRARAAGMPAREPGEDDV
jgi:hypothetical protein